MADSPAARTATRLAFLVAGFGVSCWAPLVPFAKSRVGADEKLLGLLLLCLGVGSLIAMLLTGGLSSRFGTRPVVLASGVTLSVVLPTLALASSPLALGAALLFFGASLGSLDVSMNIHAVEVERAAGRPLMSGFHALYSAGGIAGAAFITSLLSMGAKPLLSVIVGSVLMLGALMVASPRLLRTRAAEGEPHFALPHGVVLIIASLAAITFLAEGAILDWSALLITSKGIADVEQGGLGYLLFSVAMTLGRFSGDALTARIGDRPTMVWGSLVAMGGFAVLLLAPIAAVALAGFVLIGLGAANIVPVLFRRAGNQTVMPAALAIASVTTLGYAGILLGPALIGYVAKHVGLATAFWMLPALLALVTLSAAAVAPRSRALRDARR